MCFTGLHVPAAPSMSQLTRKGNAAHGLATDMLRFMKCLAVDAIAIKLRNVDIINGYCQKCKRYRICPKSNTVAEPEPRDGSH